MEETDAGTRSTCPYAHMVQMVYRDGHDMYQLQLVSEFPVMSADGFCHQHPIARTGQRVELHEGAVGTR